MFEYDLEDGSISRLFVYDDGCLEIVMVVDVIDVCY